MRLPKDDMQEADRTIVIDPSRCCGCGLCVANCPYDAMQVENGVAAYAGPCFLCGHCYALCPEAAITMAAQDFSLHFNSFQEITEPVSCGAGDTADLVALMRSRRSCRQYLDRPVPLSMLEDLVKIGTTAPSGTNSQGWNFTILPERREVLAFGHLVADFYRKINRLAGNPVIRTLPRLFGNNALHRYYQNHFQSVAEALKEWDESGRDRLFHGAPALIVVTADDSASCPLEDGMLATENMLLAAHTMGLGTCLIGFAVEALRRDRRMRQAIGLANDQVIAAVIALGFPAVSFLRFTGRRAVPPRIVRFGE